jgi:hypothetical protein
MLQTIVFPKANFNKHQAISWLMEHGHHANQIDEKPNTWRFRQHPPTFNKYYTITLPEKVELVYGEN